MVSINSIFHVIAVNVIQKKTLQISKEICTEIIEVNISQIKSYCERCNYAETTWKERWGGGTSESPAHHSAH